MKSDILYVAELAAKLGRSETAIRAAIHQRSKSIPPPGRMGKRYFWKAADVEAWIDEQKKKGSAT